MCCRHHCHLLWDTSSVVLDGSQAAQCALQEHGPMLELLVLYQDIYIHFFPQRTINSLRRGTLSDLLQCLDIGVRMFIRTWMYASARVETLRL